jgi:ABC-type uncharacterized transport system ATPase subunit
MILKPSRAESRIVWRTLGFWILAEKPIMELRIEGLSKSYPNGVKALDNVSLTIPHGMYGLLGPNGEGKFTPMRTIAGSTVCWQSCCPLG